jgi:hypothetical protein
LRLQPDGDANPAPGYVYGGGCRYAGAYVNSAEAERHPHACASHVHTDRGGFAHAVAQPD